VIAWQDVTGRDADFHHSFPRREGRRAFGGDPAGYQRARPAYPARVFDVLVERCGLSAGTATLEIGPGPGTASRELVARGAEPYVGVEPDERLAAQLEAWLRASARAASVHVCAFEDVVLEPGSFDLAVAATSFHWVEPRAGLAKVASLLRAGGWWAMWWTVFADPERRDPFHDASHPMLQRVTGEEGPSGTPLPLQVDARTAELEAAGFREVAFEAVRSEWTATPAQVRDLYATFSPIARLADAPRAELLDALARLARDEFAGRVVRPIVTACYVARKPGAAPRRGI